MSSTATPEEPDWDDLVRGARRGDPAAQAALVERLWPRVAGMASRNLPRGAEIEDLAQEVFLRVFSRLWQFRGGSFPAWVDRIARNVCYDALRRQRVRPETVFADEEVARRPDPRAGDPVRNEAAALVALLLRRIAPEQAWLLREVDLCGRSIGEVSREMGWTEVAGRLRLLRARRSLRRAYEALEPPRNDVDS